MIKLLLIGAFASGLNAFGQVEMSQDQDAYSFWSVSFCRGNNQYYYNHPSGGTALRSQNIWGIESAFSSRWFLGQGQRSYRLGVQVNWVKLNFFMHFPDYSSNTTGSKYATPFAHVSFLNVGLTNSVNFDGIGVLELNINGGPTFYHHNGLFENRRNALSPIITPQLRYVRGKNIFSIEYTRVFEIGIPKSLDIYEFKRNWWSLTYSKIIGS